MNIKQKIRSAISNFKSRKKSAEQSDSELAADEVITREVFPNESASENKKRQNKKSGKQTCKKQNKSAKAETATDNKVTPRAKKVKDASKKPASKRTRPTNADYTMIDPSGDTVDTGKS